MNLIYISRSNSQPAQQLSRKTLPHVVFCRIWRWPDLQNCNELKPVSHCQHAYSPSSHNQTSKNKIEDTQLVCINPYHYMRCNGSSDSTGQNQHLNTSNLLTVYVPINNANLQQQHSHLQSQISSDLMPIAEDETSSPLSSTASTPISYSHSPQQYQVATHISSSSSTSSYSSLQNDIVIPQLNNNNNLNSTALFNHIPPASIPAAATETMISNSSYPGLQGSTSPLQIDQQSTMLISSNNNQNANADQSTNMINYFMRSNSPHSPLGSSMASNFNINSQSPISNSPASNLNALQQFSPFVSEDDCSEINDVSPSPIGSCRSPIGKQVVIVK